MNSLTPAGWKECYVSDYFDLLIGGTPSRNTSSYWDTQNETNNVWVSIKDLKGRFITESSEHITKSGVDKSNVKLIPAATVIMSFKLTIGRVSITSLPLYTNEAIVAFKPRYKGEVDTNYLYYGLQSWDLFAEVDQAVKGATLNKDKMSRIVGLFPPLPEQQKIAAILTSVDDVIEKTQAQINKLQDLKKGTMNELLTRGIGHTEFKDSPVGMIPVDWEVQPVGETCLDIIDCVNKTAPVVDHPTPYKMIRTTNVRHGEIDTDNVRYVSEETFNIWTRRGVLRKNDIVFTREAPVGESGLVHEPQGLFLGQRTMLYRTNPVQTNPHYLLFAFQSEYCKKQLEDMTGGSTVGHMRVPDCSKILFLHCPKDEQDRIASIGISLNNSIKFLKQKLHQTQSLKKSLMQDLLTGKVRVMVN